MNRIHRVNLLLASVAVAAILFLCPRSNAKQEKAPAPQAPASQTQAPQTPDSQASAQGQDDDDKNPFAPEPAAPLR